MSNFNLKRYGIHVDNVLRNCGPALLYEEAIRRDPSACIADTGALIAHSGEKTGRSPKDKRVVKNPESENDIWWGPVNFPLDELTFQINRERAKDYLNTRDILYCVDTFAGWVPEHRIKVRIICARPYHALFISTMLIKPTVQELDSFGEPDYVIFNAGQFPSNRLTAGMTSTTTVDLNFEDREMVILGTEYAGEMKKGVFTILNYLMPKEGVLSMHCSATTDPKTDRSSLFFGLSGTGKTTLSADPKRLLVGDDEHCWTDNGIFNMEGGCYAKTIDLTEESEPEIFRALRFGSLLENVIVEDQHHHVDYSDASITENTRGAYPIEYIENAKVPCIAGHPRDIIFLTCDAFGIIPPISKLSPEHAMYHFISGYTAKVAGTEMGITEPEVTFSACFGSPFLVWHPSKYAQMLAERMKKHNTNVWLINTGWSGGAYGTGSRIKLPYTRAIIDAIHSGELDSASRTRDPVFGFEVINQCLNVPSEMLLPKNTWADTRAFNDMSKKLGDLFIENFKTYEEGISGAVKAAGPRT